MSDEQKDDLTGEAAAPASDDGQAGDANPGEADAEPTEAKDDKPAETTVDTAEEPTEAPAEPKEETPADASVSAEATADEEAKADEPAETDPESSSGEKPADDGGYQFDDDLSASDPADEMAAEAPASTRSGGGGNAGGGGGGGGGRFAKELFSKTIHAKFRTFYVDLKESSNGKFVKVSEKSRGRKSTIMMDAEDVPAIIEALQEAQGKL